LCGLSLCRVSCRAPCGSGRCFARPLRRLLSCEHVVSYTCKRWSPSRLMCRRSRLTRLITPNEKSLLTRLNCTAPLIAAKVHATAGGTFGALAATCACTFGMQGVPRRKFSSPAARQITPSSLSQSRAPAAPSHVASMHGGLLPRPTRRCPAGWRRPGCANVSHPTQHPPMPAPPHPPRKLRQSSSAAAFSVMMSARSRCCSTPLRPLCGARRALRSRSWC
jgi:hypothetical protein